MAKHDQPRGPLVLMPYRSLSGGEPSPGEGRRSATEGHVRRGVARGRGRSPLRVAVCCAVPLVLLGVLAVGGRALLGVNAGFLTVVLAILALLACPLVMLFLMRGMRRRPRGEDGSGAITGDPKGR